MWGTYSLPANSSTSNDEKSVLTPFLQNSLTNPSLINLRNDEKSVLTPFLNMPVDNLTGWRVVATGVGLFLSERGYGVFEGLK